MSARTPALDAPCTAHPDVAWLFDTLTPESLARMAAEVRRDDARRPNARATATHCKRGHLWTEANTYMLAGSRECRTCRAAHRRESRARRGEITADVA